MKDFSPKQALRSMIKSVSHKATIDAATTEKSLCEAWELSKQLFPSMMDHFTLGYGMDSEMEARVRFLVSCQAAYLKPLAQELLVRKEEVSLADVGDSDGTTRLLLEKLLGQAKFRSLGINLQSAAVEKIRARGLEAIHADAMDLGRQGQTFDIVTVFETLEHLPNPIGFLQEIAPVVGEYLVISVPHIHSSRVSLSYMNGRWPADKKATIENVHIFELSPTDWKKLIAHSGWEVVQEKVFHPFQPSSPTGLLMQMYWKKVSFDGFWFATLRKNDSFSKRYSIQ